MKTRFKIMRRLVEEIRKDLRRPHSFAMERVGFVLCRFGVTSKQDLLMLGYNYHPVADEDYIDDELYGAVINSNAFRKVMQLAYSNPVGLFHIHLHDHMGQPAPSSIDLRETGAFVPDFFHVRPNLPHGALILSADSISGRIWWPREQKPAVIDRFSIVGFPLLNIVG
jgi:hypothetical protein